MSSLDLIRSLRRALAALRDADNPAAISHVARQLAIELEASVGTAADQSDDSPSLDESEVIASFAEMAVYA
jgi:hypothetical protein